MRMNKKGQVLQNLGGLAIGIGTFAILMAVIFLVMAQTGSQLATVNGEPSFQVDNSTAANATKELINATATIPGWIPLIVIVVIGGIILAMVKTFGGGR